MSRRKKPQPLRPFIYVISVDDDEAGLDNGEWIDASLGVDHMREKIDEMFPDDSIDWVITDVDDFDDIDIDEDEDLEDVSRIAQLLLTHGRLVRPIFDMYGMRWLDDVENTLTERYAGSGETLGEWAKEETFAGEWLDNVPEDLIDCIDFELYAEKRESNGEFFTVEVDDRVHVFLNR